MIVWMIFGNNLLSSFGSDVLFLSAIQTDKDKQW